MAACWHHAVSSARKFGGKPEDYIRYHMFFDESKGHLADFRHRALRHHTEGIKMSEVIFGPFIENSDGRRIPTTLLGEQHVTEDLGFIPKLSDWLLKIQPEAWMMRGRKLGQELETTNT